MESEMMDSSWISLGASVIGPSHISSNVPNQDYWLAHHDVGSDCVIVADGLGSCSHSEIGAKAVCLAVLDVVSAYVGPWNLATKERFLESVRDRFLQELGPMSPEECATTCLIAWRSGDELRIFQLGDGMVGALRSDGHVDLLEDDKSESFANLVRPLSAKTSVSEWRICSIPVADCLGVVLCTDGVSEDLCDTQGFVRELVLSAREEGADSIRTQLEEYLRKWPVPKHTDDKTVVCLFKEEVLDGE